MAQVKTKKTKTEKKTKQTLVIVESPAKAKTIEKYLGPGFTVKASMGHLIDLPKSRMAIDVDNNFQPEYITVRGRAKILKELQKDAKKSDVVLLASDNDREGEAIAWHLNNSFKDKTKAEIQRIVFNEITPVAITEAVKNPSEIDESKVNAQKARRVLDRLVGYNLSPLLWKKVKNGLSAGRVQSVALRLICEREKEVEDFIPEEYWSLEADFAKGKSTFTAQLVQYAGKKPELKNEQQVKDIIEEIKNSECTVTEIKETEKTIRPKAPFTTSKLQQAAANRLGFTSKKTMQIAQQLYEGINIGSNRVGLITYMRTDSTRISQTALDDVRKWIGEKHPDELPSEAIEYSVGKKAQDAHEAIRPTSSLDKGTVRAIDLANYLGFSRPTVSIALRQLESDGYIEINDNAIELTEQGKNIALTMYERHEYIARILMKLGVDKKIASEDACRIEHVISKESFEAIKKYIKE